ncbi:flagellar M-ring protein FliF [bacterium]|nr:flagellar M-ring protein FliF [bacterium]
MADRQPMLAQLQNLFSGLSWGKKISFAIFLALGVGLFLGVVKFAGQPQFRLLYSDLAAEDLSAIVEKLKTDRVPYQIGAAGDSISVPEDRFYETRMALATDGLPRGGSMGFEIFDRKSAGMTEFEQRINFLRAMQGELERTISQIAAIDRARVHVAIPKETLFKEDKRDATASVIVKLKPNARLTEEEIDGIANLVAGSVDGLDAGNVNLMDQRGKILTQGKREDVAGPVNPAMIDYQRRLEMNLENRIHELLARVVGPEKVSTKVTAMLDFRQVTKVEEVYDPDSQVARSEHLTNESNTGTEESTAGGAPGIDANVPNDSYNEGSRNSSAAEKKRETINYEISKVTSQISEPVGEIKRLSVAVMVDGTYAAVEEDGKTTKTYVKRTPEEMATITELVKKAIGFNETRGDQLEVANVAFQSEFEEPNFDEGGVTADLVRTIVNYVLYGVLLLIVAIMGLRLVRFLTAGPAPAELTEFAGMLPAGLDEMERRLSGGAETSRLRLPAGDDGDEAPREPGESERDRMKKLSDQRKLLIDNASKDQKAVTLMVRKWLKEQI